MSVAKVKDMSVYRNVTKLVFSGELSPGQKISEQALSEKLGVSRIPIRETLAKLVGQGVLVGGRKGQSARMRSYSPDELHQLFEYRGALEGIAARAAVRAATDADIIRMDLICERAEAEVGDCRSKRWGELDHAFHATLADASRNERVAKALKLLVDECHYLFFTCYMPMPENAVSQMTNVLAEHREMIEMIRQGDADGAERVARVHIDHKNQVATRAIIEQDLCCKVETA